MFTDLRWILIPSMMAREKREEILERCEVTQILARSQERSEGLPARPLSPVARSDINNNILRLRTEDWRDKNNNPLPRISLQGNCCVVNIGNEVTVTVTMLWYISHHIWLGLDRLPVHLSSHFSGDNNINIF